MPFPLIAAAAPVAAKATSTLLPSIISGGASLLGGLINAGSTSATNQSQLSYSKEMYEKQRADALADWKMQNEYNSPSAQMMRFKEAGLNPNLIYGQMTNSPAVRSSTSQSYNPTAPQLDLGSTANMALSQYYDTQMKKAQIDNLKEQNMLYQQDGLIKAFEAVGKSLENQKNQFQVHKQEELFKTTLEGLNATIRNTKASTLMSEEQRNKIVAEIENIGKTGKILDQESKLKDLLINLKSLGLNESDNVLIRLIAQFLSK